MTHTLQRWLARLLVSGGAAVLVWVAVDVALATWSRRQDEASLQRIYAPVTAGDTPAVPASLVVGDPIGTLYIPRLGVAGIVVEGDESAVLDRAIGHLPDTPLPWQTGNSALAAHRDTIFRPLEDVRPGDVLRLATPHGDFDYRVRETLVVKPDDLWVLDATSTSTLTLISCYPFNYIGHAPERFIVRAERIPVGDRYE